MAHSLAAGTLYSLAGLAAASGLAVPIEEFVHRRIRGPHCSTNNHAGDPVNLMGDLVIKR